MQDQRRFTSVLSYNLRDLRVALSYFADQKLWPRALGRRTVDGRPSPTMTVKKLAPSQPGSRELLPALTHPLGGPRNRGFERGEQQPWISAYSDEQRMLVDTVRAFVDEGADAP